MPLSLHQLCTCFTVYPSVIKLGYSFGKFGTYNVIESPSTNLVSFLTDWSIIIFSLSL